MLPSLIEEFRQEMYRPTAFYWIWNQFVVKLKDLSKIKEVKDVLVEGVRCLYQGVLCDKKRVKGNLPIAHGLLILQHLVTLHGDKLTPQ